jgi:hypothetical protein
MKREDELDEMAERSKRLGEDISDAREDWERKKADDSVPGTPPASSGTDQDDSREPWPDE